MLAIPEYVLKGAPWSLSKVGVIEKCSKQYDFKYGPNKIPEQRTPSEESRIGNAVHKALELVLGGTKQDLAFRIAADELNLTESENDRLMGFWDQVAAFKKRMDAFRLKHGVHPGNVLIEKRWAIKPDFSPIEFFDKKGLMRGVLDYGLITAKKDVIIIDHKSGKEREAEYYVPQFRIYALLALASNPDIRGVQTAINFIVPDKLNWYPYIPREQIENEFKPWLVTYLSDLCKGLLNPPTEQKGWWCNWCGYKPICPAFGGNGCVNENK